MQGSEGQWMFLFLQDEKGSLVPTKNQLQIDSRFELPMGEFWYEKSDKTGRLLLC